MRAGIKSLVAIGVGGIVLRKMPEFSAMFASLTCTKEFYWLQVLVSKCRCNVETDQEKNIRMQNDDASACPLD